MRHHHHSISRFVLLLVAVSGLLFMAPASLRAQQDSHGDGEADDHGGTSTGTSAPTGAPAASAVHVSAPARAQTRQRARVVFVPISGTGLVKAGSVTLNDTVGTTTRSLPVREAPPGVYSFHGFLAPAGLHSLSFTVVKDGQSITQTTQVIVEEPSATASGVGVEFASQTGALELPAAGGTLLDSLAFSLTNADGTPRDLTTTEAARVRVFIERPGRRTHGAGIVPQKVGLGRYSIDHAFTEFGRHNVTFWFDENGDNQFQRDELATFTVHVEERFEPGARHDGGDGHDDGDTHGGGDSHDGSDTHDTGSEGDSHDTTGTADTHGGGGDSHDEGDSQS